MAQKSKEIPGIGKIRLRLIRERAEEIFNKRAEEGIPGDAYSDWVQAEKELMN